MIQVEGLVKHYASGQGTVKAVDGVSFTACNGQITGLLGPNGAGKTTTLRIIAGLVKPMKGSVTIDGQDVTRPGSHSARKLLGVQSDSTGVYPRMTPREQLRYYGRFYGLKGEALEGRVQAVIDMLNMQQIADRRAEGFSRGERQKVILGRSLVHDPPNIIMDEPTNGLDVMSVRETRDTIRELAMHGRCVLFSTHHMDEAERMCDRIAIIVQGKIVASGTPGTLIEETGKLNLEEAFVALGQ